MDCWKLCNSFHEFHEKVHVAQTNYLKQLIKYERENHFIEIPTVHLNADATIISEQIDELHETNGLAPEPTIKLEYETCKNAPSPPLVSIELVPEQMNDDSIGIESTADDDDEEDEADALDYDNFEQNSSYAQSENDEDENESGKR